MAGWLEMLGLSAVVAFDACRNIRAMSGSGILVYLPETWRFRDNDPNLEPGPNSIEPLWVVRTAPCL